MRLITLVLALVIIAGLLVYYKDAMLGPKTDTNQTVVEQSRQIIDSAKQSSEDMQKALEAQQKKMEQLENK